MPTKDNKQLTQYPVQNRIINLQAQADAQDLIIRKLVRIQLKTLAQMKRAAQKLGDPRATRVIGEIEVEFKKIRKLISNVKAG